MRKLCIDLENCYGIGSLKCEFDFRNKAVHALYASNGTMKSSLAQTLQDLAEDKASVDRIFPTRVTKRTITDENGTPLTADQVLVVKPYDEFFSREEKASTLLVNSDLRRQYEKLQEDIDEAEDNLVEALLKRTATKKDIRAEIQGAFSARDHLTALGRAKAEIEAYEDQGFDSLTYDSIFDEKVLALLKTKNIKEAITEYITKYNELLSKSVFFKKGIFNYFNAATIGKALADNGFFKASHKLQLSGDQSVDISTPEELAKVIEEEKKAILKDKDLEKRFQEVEKQINKNIDVRGFESYLSDHEEILPKLADIDSFKQELWIHYLWNEKYLYSTLLEKVEIAREEKARIEEAARSERTRWEEVIDIFNGRFHVPFKLTAKNRVSAVLGNGVLKLGFEFNERGDTAEVERDTLLKTLSTGERKAFYILNVVFEIESRKDSGQDCLIIFDDIADSFDYKNKFAIIQYIDDTFRTSNCKVILLTHNFDFLRTVESRFVPRNNCRIARKEGGAITLTDMEGVRNIFSNSFKEGFFKNDRKMLASIPFMRNLLEYTVGDQHADYVLLTSLLHFKPDTLALTRGALAEVFGRLFAGTESISSADVTVFETLIKEADESSASTTDLGLETKVILSIATRMIAEQFVTGKLDAAGVSISPGSNQARELVEAYKVQFPTDLDVHKVLDRMQLMTPENIHLNAFMYEPLIDMSDEHLRSLYRDLRTHCV